VLWLALGGALLFAFVALGRAQGRPGGPPDLRVAAGLLATALLLAAAVLAVRGAYVPAAGLAFAALAAATLTRRPPRAPPQPRIRMSVEEARGILGVGPDADAEAVQAAYVRLMRRVHPDAGGATGLAAQLNAARDRLLR
jgi:hypothetical protein